MLGAISVRAPGLFRRLPEYGRVFGRFLVTVAAFFVIAAGAASAHSHEGDCGLMPVTRDSQLEPLSSETAEKLDAALRSAYSAARLSAATGDPVAVAPAAPAVADKLVEFTGLGRGFPDPDVVLPTRVRGDTVLRTVVSTTDVEALRCAGARVRSHIGSVVTADVPADALDDVARLPSVTRVEAPKIMRPLNDLGRRDAEVPEAVASHNATGKGVIVGVIDTGIDFTHRSFIDAEGHTRIKALLDLADPGDLDGDGDLDGSGPHGGTLYTPAQIEQAIRDLRSGHAKVYRSTYGPQEIPDEDALVSSIRVTSGECVQIDTLHVRLQIDHSYLADLSVDLVSPHGRRFELLGAGEAAEEQGTLAGHYTVWGLAGQSTLGEWELEVEDHAEEDTGELLAWSLMANSVVRQEDLHGHGTHVAGSAAGDGAGPGESEPGQYAGVAPEADIVVVRATRDLAGSFMTDDWLDALSWLDGYARQAGQPYVVNLSLGGARGPRDGTTQEEEAVDALVGAGRSGKAVVSSAGNEGARRGHTSGQFTALRNEVELTYPARTYGDRVEVWFEGSRTMQFSFRPAGSLDCHPDCDVDISPDGPVEMVLFHRRGTVVAYSFVYWETSASNGLHSVTAIMGGVGGYFPQGDWELVFGRARGKWHAWSRYEEPFGSRGDNRMTIGTPAGAHNIITVGSHCTRQFWTDITGEAHNADGTVDQLSPFSSRGPTRDGRTKPEIAAPGEMIISARSKSGAIPTERMISAEHAIFEGTSMAAPHVTGVVALLMSLPGGDALDASEIRDLLVRSARVDTYVGSTPNDDWGWGKLDAHELLVQCGLPAAGQIAPTPTPSRRATATRELTRPAATATSGGVRPVPTDTRAPSATAVTWPTSTTEPTMDMRTAIAATLTALASEPAPTDTAPPSSTPVAWPTPTVKPTLEMRTAVAATLTALATEPAETDTPKPSATRTASPPPTVTPTFEMHTAVAATLTALAVTPSPTSVRHSGRVVYVPYAVRSRAYPIDGDQASPY